MKLVVIDLLGSEVATLVNEKKPAGSYSVRFGASGLASGVYFYRLEVCPLDLPLVDSAQKRDSESGAAIGRDSKSGVGSFVDTKKFVLLR